MRPEEVKGHVQSPNVAINKEGSFLADGFVSRASMETPGCLNQTMVVDLRIASLSSRKQGPCWPEGYMRGKAASWRQIKMMLKRQGPKSQPGDVLEQQNLFYVGMCADRVHRKAVSGLWHLQPQNTRHSENLLLKWDPSFLELTY